MKAGDSCPKKCDGSLRSYMADGYLLCSKCESTFCPRCGDEVYPESWWDDPPEMGGACIGTMYVCEPCDWMETI